MSRACLFANRCLELYGDVVSGKGKLLDLSLSILTSICVITYEKIFIDKESYINVCNLKKNNIFILILLINISFELSKSFKESHLHIHRRCYD